MYIHTDIHTYVVHQICTCIHMHNPMYILHSIEKNCTGEVDIDR